MKPPGSINYPLCVQAPGCDISFFRAHLEALRLKNTFCLLFPPGLWMRPYGSYELLLENLFRGVLAAVLKRMLLGTRARCR